MDNYAEEILASRKAAEAITAPKDTIDQAALRERQRYAESTYNDKAVSKAGAKGAFQIMPAVYEEYSKKMGETGDLFDSDYNGRMRDRIWNDLYNSFTATNKNPSDRIRTAKAAAMYNRGRGAVGDFLDKEKKAGVDIYNSLDWVDHIPWDETKNYVKWVVFGDDVPGTQMNKKQFEAAKAIRNKNK